MLNPKDCKKGEEQYEKFQKRVKGTRTMRNVYQYDYRTPQGELFSCIGRTLDSARRKRDTWLAERNEEKVNSI